MMETEQTELNLQHSTADNYGVCNWRESSRVLNALPTHCQAQVHAHTSCPKLSLQCTGMAAWLTHMSATEWGRGSQRRQGDWRPERGGEAVSWQSGCPWPLQEVNVQHAHRDTEVSENRVGSSHHADWSIHYKLGP